MRTLDDVYGADLDGFPLEQEARPGPLPLDWNEAANDPSYRYAGGTGEPAPDSGTGPR